MRLDFGPWGLAAFATSKLGSVLVPGFELGAPGLGLASNLEALALGAFAARQLAAAT